MKAIIVDDELNARVVLKNYMEEYCPEIEIVGMADGVEEGVALTRKNAPNIVFLDIQMNDGTGFDFLERFDTIDFKVIFTTAYDQYAIKAFHYSALYYILKPIDPDELVTAVSRAKEMIENYSQATDSFKSGIKKGSFDHLTIRTEKKYHVVQFDDIHYLEADGNYTTLHLSNREKIVASKLMREFEEILIPKGFFRIHKSYILNLKAIDTLIQKSNTVKLKCGTSLTVSRRNKAEFLKQL